MNPPDRLSIGGLVAQRHAADLDFTPPVKEWIEFLADLVAAQFIREFEDEES